MQAAPTSTDGSGKRRRLIFYAPEAKGRDWLDAYRLYIDGLIRLGNYEISIMAPNASPFATFARDTGITLHPLSDFSRTLLVRAPQLWPILTAMGRFRYDLALTPHASALRGLSQIARKTVGICLDDHLQGFEAAHHVITQTSGSASEAQDLFERKSGIDVLPPPHLCDWLVMKDLLDDRPFTIGAGADVMDEDQALGRFIHAAQLIRQELPDVRFVLAGAGGEEHDLRELADKIAPFVEFVGVVGDDEMVELCDIYCSTALQEAYSSRLCAMMDAGLCCLATCTNGSMDILKAGMVAPMLPTDDSFMLAVQLIDLLQDRAQIMRIKQACFERIREEDFHLEAFTSRFGEILDDAL